MASNNFGRYSDEFIQKIPRKAPGDTVPCLWGWQRPSLGSSPVQAPRGSLSPTEGMVRLPASHVPPQPRSPLLGTNPQIQRSTGSVERRIPRSRL